jgi:hypothetical protein
MQIPATATMVIEKVVCEITENFELIPAASFVENAHISEYTPSLTCRLWYLTARR